MPPAVAKYAMKISSERAELLRVLAELADLYPEWRMGQTLANLAMFASRMDAGGVWDLEDGEAIAAARHLLEKNRQQVVSHD
jgi:hypothetical protein